MYARSGHYVTELPLLSTLHTGSDQRSTLNNMTAKDLAVEAM